MSYDALDELGATMRWPKADPVGRYRYPILSYDDRINPTPPDLTFSGVCVSLICSQLTDCQLGYLLASHTWENQYLCIGEECSQPGIF